jgi:hypothetical protein
MLKRCGFTRLLDQIGQRASVGDRQRRIEPLDFRAQAADDRGVADDDRRCPIDLGGVGRRERASRERPHAEHIEEIDRHERAVHALRHGAAAYRVRDWEHRGQSGEAARAVAVIAKVRRRHARAIAARKAAANPQQSIRGGKRQPAKEHRVNEREIAVLAPMAGASVTTAAIVNAGACRSVRAP